MLLNCCVTLLSLTSESYTVRSSPPPSLLPSLSAHLWMPSGRFKPPSTNHRLLLLSLKPHPLSLSLVHHFLITRKSFLGKWKERNNTSVPASVAQIHYRLESAIIFTSMLMILWYISPKNPDRAGKLEVFNIKHHIMEFCSDRKGIVT